MTIFPASIDSITQLVSTASRSWYRQYRTAGIGSIAQLVSKPEELKAQVSNIEYRKQLVSRYFPYLCIGQALGHYMPLEITQARRNLAFSLINFK